MNTSSQAPHCTTCTCDPAAPVAASATAELSIISNLDREIERLSSLLLRIKEQRNALIPVARLPPEVLSHIFTFYRTLCRTWGPTWWIQVTHVSRTWRAIALADPLLWNTITLRFPNLAAEIIKRSRDIPQLHITLAYPTGRECDPSSYHSYLRGDYNVPETFALLARPTCEIATIDASGSNDELGKLLVATIHSSKTMRSITLYNDVDDFAEPLPHEVSNSSFPLLTTLCLTDCLIGWNCPLISGSTALQSLNFTYSDVEREEDCGTINELLAALQHLIRLEELHLNWCLFERRSIVPKRPSVRLPRLSSLHLLDGAMECAVFVNALDLPMACEVSVVCKRAPLWDYISLCFSLLPPSGEPGQTIVIDLPATDGALEVHFGPNHPRNVSRHLNIPFRADDMPLAILSLALIESMILHSSGAGPLPVLLEAQADPGDSSSARVPTTVPPSPDVLTVNGFNMSGLLPIFQADEDAFLDNVKQRARVRPLIIRMMRCRNIDMERKAKWDAAVPGIEWGTSAP